MTWEKVEEAVREAHSIAWEGCHKIYVLMDEQETEQMRSYGYGDEDDSESELRLVADMPETAMTVLRRWWDESCGLRFINAVRSPGGNDDFENLIAQFEDAEDEE